MLQNKTRFRSLGWGISLPSNDNQVMLSVGHQNVLLDTKKDNGMLPGVWPAKVSDHSRASSPQKQQAMAKDAEWKDEKPFHRTWML